MGLLGSLTPAEFVARHWQKKPLLVRQAIPGFTGIATPAQLARLASHDDVVARAVTQTRGTKKPRYRLQHGPLPHVDMNRAPTEFTFLIQGLEQHLPDAWELLARFSFLPWARIDDLMVSVATPGGSVGPHVDRYDVFLLQGMGRRRWRIANVVDRPDFDPQEELKILRRFDTTEEWVLEPGDMLYLPPGVPHWGIAEDLCTTWSIGFLAPSHEQLAQNFLAFLSQSPDASPTGIYSDPDLRVQPHPAELVDDTLARVERVLQALTWDRARVAEFTGRLLTGPKPSVQFTAPTRTLSRGSVVELLRGTGTLALTRSSRMLFRDDAVFLNGEMTRIRSSSRDALHALADTRRVALPCTIHDDDIDMLVAWHANGFIRFEGNAARAIKSDDVVRDAAAPARSRGRPTQPPRRDRARSRR